MRTENRRERTERLKKEGRWDAYLDRLEELKGSGISDAKAGKQAKAEFAPKLDFAPRAKAENPDGLYKSDFAGRPEVSARDVVMWIFDNILILDVAAEDAPSAGAWAYLMEIRTSPIIRSEFYRTVYPKLLPSKAQIDNEARYTDDGHKVLGLIERVRKASEESILQARAEGFDTKPPVSGANA